VVYSVRRRFSETGARGKGGGGRKDPQPAPNNPQQQRSFCDAHPVVCIIGPLLPLLLPPLVGLPPIPVLVP